MRFEVKKIGEKFNYKILIIFGIFIALILLFLIPSRYLKTENEARGNKVYKTEEFSFNYPEEWQEISLEEISQKVDSELEVGFGDLNGEGKFLLSAKEGVPRIQSLKEVEQELDKAMEKNFNSFKKISSEKTKISGREGLEYNYTYKSEKEEIRQKIILIFGEEKIYYLIFHAPKEKFEAYEENFDLIISTFKI